MTVAPTSLRKDIAVSWYRGFTIVTSIREVDVFDAEGRHVGTAFTPSGARRIINGYRRVSR